jgi:hypothetical protein
VEEKSGGEKRAFKFGPDPKEIAELIMVKLLVTHIFPDLDALTALWLFKRYDLNCETAEIKFVPAGTVWKNKAVDSDPSVIHVDTGLGRFDHHQTDKKICAAGLVFEWLQVEKKIPKKHEEALKRLIRIVNQVDHFEDFYWPTPADDRYDFCLHHLLDHLKLSGKLNDRELVAQAFLLLEALVEGLRQKIVAEAEIKAGQEFQTIWGRSLGVETKLSRVAKLAQKLGFKLVVRKEPETGFVAIKCQPRHELDLEKAYQALKQADTQADWYFHPSRHIILNGSRHDRLVKPSRLSLGELIEILKQVK